MSLHPHSDSQKQRKAIRYWLFIFIICLILSGLTASPLDTELQWLLGIWPFHTNTALYHWVQRTYSALRDSNKQYPFLAYGYDWLAFAHIVIAIAFIGPLRDPVRNIWVIQFGMLACIGVFPLALIAGPVRGIPLYWQLIDCSFGVIGLIPLAICYKKIRLLEKKNC